MAAQPVVWLPLIVLAGTTALIAVFGGWSLPTLYLYWQWFHYTRQSYGIAQIYRRKAGGLITEPQLLSKALIYLLPLWGILQRSWESPELFLGMEIRTLPVPLPVVQASAVCANFHHYIVDGVIWKVRKQNLRANLGLAG